MRYFAIIAILFALLGARADVAEITPWTPLFKGVDYAHVNCHIPQMQISVLRIDLDAPGIRFTTTPANGDAPLETNSQKTSSFLKATGCQAAVNTAFFSTVGSAEGIPEDLLGVAIADGALVSPPEKGYAAVLFDAGNRVRMVDQPCEVTDVRQAISGNKRILVDGVITSDPGEPWHPRTGIGLTADGRTLLLMVIDGRQDGFSDGATTYTLARWLQFFGATQAVNLDGGGSSSLVVADGAGGVRQLNHPIHNGVPGTERPVGANLGIFATPLPNKTP